MTLIDECFSFQEQEWELQIGFESGNFELPYKSSGKIDLKQAIIKEETERVILESAICQSCEGVVRFPSVWCNQCNLVYCKQQCLEEKGESKCHKCKQKLNFDHSLPKVYETIIKKIQFFSNLDSTKLFLYQDFIELMKNQVTSSEQPCPLKCGKTFTFEELKLHLSIDKLFEV